MYLFSVKHSPKVFDAYSICSFCFKISLFFYQTSCRFKLGIHLLPLRQWDSEVFKGSFNLKFNLACRGILWTCKKSGGDIMLFIRKDILPKVVSIDDRSIESFYVELNFWNKKWLLNCSYNPKHSSIDSHLDSLSKIIDLLTPKYDNFILLGDFNLAFQILQWKHLGKFTNYEIL